jgi:hypothetical protein
MTSGKANVLVVANRTAGSPELLEALRERDEAGPAHFHLVVPATPHGVSWAADMSAGEKAAEDDLGAAIARLREQGLDCDGEVGDPDPIAAVHDSAHFGDYDEVIVSTLPKHISRWLKLDLPRRVAHATGLPVKHVVAHRASVPA